jgi:hypothetical protein
MIKIDHRYTDEVAVKFVAWKNRKSLSLSRELDQEYMSVSEARDATLKKVEADLICSKLLNVHINSLYYTHSVLIREFRGLAGSINLYLAWVLL